MKGILQELLRNMSGSLPHISFEVKFWDGEAERFGSGTPSFTLAFNGKGAAKSILTRGSMGFAEELVAGGIEVAGDFQQLVRLGMESRFQNLKLSLGTKAAVFFRHLTSLNTLKRAPANITHHYDLGNEFFKLYLDESMTYSCAYFKSDRDTLEQAQEQKYEHICRKLQLREGETLVDIGCGWGGMLLYAARHYGARGLGCTLSSRQAEYAREKVAKEGLEARITILRQDYRTIQGQFDKFVSIGMFEHVGRRFIPTFMDKARALLKPGSIGLLHTIGKDRDTPSDPWTMKYVFPGAHIPTLDHVVRGMAKRGLVLVDIENLRLHYAATLDEWRRRFEANVEQVAKMFDQRLVRMWRMFLCGSAAAFRWGDLRLYQILFTNGQNNLLPLTREHLYRV
jgi:cyclopropane-fatty-acyl-phospholipid synthase